MRRPILALAAVAATLAVNPLRAEPLVLKPYGPWNVDFGEDSCRMQRLFGTDEAKQQLVLQQFWPSNRVLLTVAGPAFSKFRRSARTELRLSEDQEPIRRTPFTGTFGELGDALVFESVRFEQAAEQPDEEADTPKAKGYSQMDPALGKQARFVEVRQGSRVVRLDTGQLDAAFKVLNDCTRDLLTSFGLDAEKHLTMRSEPQWLNRAALVRRIVAAYPSSASSQGEQGLMRMRVIVREDGVVESCTILKATSTRNLESPACDVMKRAEFAPAIDAEGKPFRALYATSITYMIP